MSRIEGATIRGHKCPDQVWCASCLVDIDPAIDDYEDQGEAGLVCASCLNEADAGPEHTAHDWEDVEADPFGLENVPEPGPCDEGLMLELEEVAHRADLLRERGRQP